MTFSAQITLQSNTTQVRNRIHNIVDEVIQLIKFCDIFINMSENNSENINIKFGKGVHISPEIQYNVIQKYKELKQQNNNSNKKSQKTIYNEIKNTVTKRSVSSIKRILKNGIKKKKKRVQDPIINYCDNDFNIIDNIICDFKKRNINPFIKTLWQKVKSDPNCDLSFKHCCEKTFRKIITRMGYKYSNTQKLIRSEIIKSPRIQKKILEYLMEKHRLEKENPDSVFCWYDETHIHKNSLYNKTLQPIDPNIMCPKIRSIGKGTRYNIIHCMSVEGMIQNAAYIVKDETLNANYFENYLKHQLCPNLPPNSIVIYDNAPPHSRQYNKTPNSSNTKDSIKLWLTNNDIHYEDNMTKKHLLEIVKRNNIKPSYFVDDIIRKADHIPLRLPPYMCDLNPIEKIWNSYKFDIKLNNFNTSEEKFVGLLFDKFQKITASQCAATVRHVVKEVEAEYWKRFNISEIGLINDHNYSNGRVVSECSAAE